MEIKERDVREVGSEDMAKTLLESLILLIRTQTKPWAKLTKAEQDDVIDALRKSVRTATELGGGIGKDGQPQNTLSATHCHAVCFNRAVRKLTPIECERLQGFPDNYTKIPYRGKPAEKCPDAPRYTLINPTHRED